MPDAQDTPAIPASIHQKLLNEKQIQFQELREAFIEDGFDILPEPMASQIMTPQGHTIRWGARIVIKQIDEKTRATYLSRKAQANAKDNNSAPPKSA